MIRAMQTFYFMLFFVAKTIAKKNDPKGAFKSAYYLLSLFVSLNLIAFYNILKSFVPSLTLNFNFLIFCFMFFVPTLIFNYFYFLWNGRYIQLENNYFGKSINVKRRRPFTTFTIYIVLTILLLAFSFWLNIY